MKPCEPRRLVLLLCLLLACAPASDPSSNASNENGASRADALVTSNWNLTGTLANPRSGHTATLLPDGKVLVVGGYGGIASLASVELYDPATGIWSFTGSLAQGRQDHTATLLPSGKVLVVGGYSKGGPLTSAEVYDPLEGTWSFTGPLKQARYGHTATPLADGRVLVVAGNNGTSVLASAEVYDPSTGVWSSMGALAQAREHHTATLLPGGKVLVVAGHSATESLASAEVYDLSTGVWSSMGALAQAREHHTATLLPGGKVLVVAGRSRDGSSLAAAEVYDPVSRTWSPTGSLKNARDHHSAVLLPGGKLLVVGGYVKLPNLYGPVAAAEVYDPSSGVWSSAGSLPWGRFDLTATLLPGGQVLVAGGKMHDSTGIIPEVMAEVYTPAAGTWSPAGSLSQGRRDLTATLLPDGKVLVVGGRDRYANAFATVDVYDTERGTWSFTGTLKLNQARRNHTATLLTDGKVLVVGGYGGGAALASAEVYDLSSAASGSWSFTDSLKQARRNHTATLLPDGKVLVVGGYGEGGPLTSAEVYDPLEGTWSFTGPLKQARYGHTATLLPDGKVLVVGGCKDSITLLSSAEVYDPVTGEWSSARPMPRAHYLHTATLLADGRVLVVGGLDGRRSSMAFTEVYDPDARAWSSASPLNQPHAQHTATLLPGGRVLVAGGSGGPAEVYDPPTGFWFSVGSLREGREEHTATLLPGGKVLVVGGMADTEVASAELYMDSNEDGTWRPRLTGVSPTLLEHGTSLSVTGERFQGGFEANGGNTRSSSTNHPLLSLSSVETGRWTPLLGHDLSDTSVSATLPYVPNGYYLLNVTTRGLTSSWIISIINRTPPDTTLDSATPAPVTQSTTATFSFSSESSASFECNLDGAGFSVCASPLRYSTLRDGKHSFRVRARDLLGSVDPTPAEYHWTVDTTPPESVIEVASMPRPSTHITSASLSFSASEEGASFECSVDGSDFFACTSPLPYSDQQDGPHTFQVQATDVAGNVDPTPAEYRWTVDTVVPDTVLTSVPQGHTHIIKARFSFSSEKPGVSFECSLDTDGFTPCSSPLVSPPLSDGPHLFQVRARDAADNVDSTPAKYSWEVDTTAPDTGIEVALAPQAHTPDRSAHLSFSASEMGASFECSLDGVAFTPCQNPQDYTSLPDGTHTFQVKAIDAAGNVDPDPDTYSWEVDTVLPQRPEILVPTPNQQFFTSQPVLSGTAEPGSTVTVFIDGTPLARQATANEGGYWQLASPQLDWGPHQATATATDPAGNTSAVSLEVSFATVQRGYYGMGCAAAPSLSASWPWALLALGLLRRRRSP